MDVLVRKTIETAAGHNYTYYVSPLTANTNTTLPALLFQHGWPDSAAMWLPIVTLLMFTYNITNRIIIPDQLGYAGTSKPIYPEAYSQNRTTSDMTSILDAENIPTAISIGHDWGSTLASRLYNYHPDRVSGLVQLNVAYQPPTRTPYDLAATNALTVQQFGYPLFDYWSFFTAPDAPTILQSNVSRLYSALHATGPWSMKWYFCDPGAMRAYLTSSDAEWPEPEVRNYAKDPAMRAAFVERMTRDGFDGPQQWYVATVTNIQYESDRQLPLDRDRVGVPTLFIGATEDNVCRLEIIEGAKQAGLLPDLEERVLQAGHWTPFEKPAEIAAWLVDWVGRKFPGSV